MPDQADVKNFPCFQYLNHSFDRPYEALQREAVKATDTFETQPRSDPLR
jgi:hypothetical protein